MTVKRTALVLAWYPAAATRRLRRACGEVGSLIRGTRPDQVPAFGGRLLDFAPEIGRAPQNEGPSQDSLQG
jgi:hypothetical protein